MKSSKRGSKPKEMEVEVILTPGRNEEKVKKLVEKKLILNTIKYILEKITHFELLNTFKNVSQSVFESGIIIAPALITILDVTIGYQWGWMTIIHIIGCGSIYHIVDDLIDKVKRKR